MRERVSKIVSGARIGASIVTVGAGHMASFVGGLKVADALAVHGQAALSNPAFIPIYLGGTALSVMAAWKMSGIGKSDKASTPAQTVRRRR